MNEARVNVPRLPRHIPRRSTRTSAGGSAERGTASAQAHMGDQHQMMQEVLAAMEARRPIEDFEAPSFISRYIGMRAALAEVPGMPGHAAQQGSEYSVGYHAGSRATCLVCPFCTPCAVDHDGSTRLQMHSCPRKLNVPSAPGLAMLAPGETSVAAQVAVGGWLPGTDGGFPLTADTMHAFVGQGCPVPIAPGEVRMQRRGRMPPRGVMVQQYWHPQCFHGWATLPHPLPGVEQLRPRDQVIDYFCLSPCVLNTEAESVRSERLAINDGKSGKCLPTSLSQPDWRFLQGAVQARMILP